MIIIKLYVIILFRLFDLFFSAKKIGIKKPNTLLEAIIKAFNKQSITGMIFFLSFPSNRKKVKKIRFKIETGFPP